ncbi:MAG: hypothetical protein R3E96_01255 [Planctomycetota bacterium]
MQRGGRSFELSDAFELAVLPQGIDLLTGRTGVIRDGESVVFQGVNPGAELEIRVDPTGLEGLYAGLLDPMPFPRTCMVGGRARQTAARILGGLALLEATEQDGGAPRTANCRTACVPGWVRCRRCNCPPGNGDGKQTRTGPI